jgi:hypothetical protein
MGVLLLRVHMKVGLRRVKKMTKPHRFRSSSILKTAYPISIPSAAVKLRSMSPRHET